MALCLCGCSFYYAEQAGCIKKSEFYHDLKKFLTSNMPEKDKDFYNNKNIEEILDYALMSRSIFPWCKELEESDFKHYVLPGRVSMEPPENNRRILYDKILPLVQDCKTIQEAVRTINIWCSQKAIYEKGSGLDQSPLQILKSGKGRCEELSILFCAAARSVGIPCRLAMVPLWVDENGNHAWPEILIEGKWKHIEAGVPSDINKTWFTNKLLNIPLVVAYTYGEADNDNIIYKKSCFSIVNVTSNYTRTKHIKITVYEDSKLVDRGRVWFSVYNYGSLRPIAYKFTNEKGVAKIELGPSKVVVSSGSNYNLGLKIVDTSLNPNVQLKIEKVKSYYCLDNIALINSDGLNQLKNFTQSLQCFPYKLFYKVKDRLRIQSIYQRKINEIQNINSDILDIFETVGANNVSISLVCEEQVKDYFYLDNFALLKNYNISRKARNRISDFLKYDDDMFVQFVQKMRIDNEQASYYKDLISIEHVNYEMHDIKTMIIDMTSHIKEKFLINFDQISPRSLKSIVESKLVYIDELAILFCAYFRTFGVPCKKDGTFKISIFDKAWKIYLIKIVNGNLFKLVQVENKFLLDSNSKCLATKHSHNFNVIENGMFINLKNEKKDQYDLYNYESNSNVFLVKKIKNNLIFNKIN